jgi:NADP-dependent 3-hydroxy acid dehydrogenase YdfG
MTIRNFSQEERMTIEGKAVESLDVLINNAGVSSFDDLSERARWNSTSPSTCTARMA